MRCQGGRHHLAAVTTKIHASIDTSNAVLPM